jgi:hypothetical protein
MACGSCLVVTSFVVMLMLMLPIELVLLGSWCSLLHHLLLGYLLLLWGARVGAGLFLINVGPLCLVLLS